MDVRPSGKEKSENEKAKIYKAVLSALIDGPKTVDQLAEVVPFSRARITQALQVMCTVGDAHIGSRVPAPNNTTKRCFHYGKGKDVKSKSARKNNPVLAESILSVLEGSMTIKQIARRVFRTRSAVQMIVQLLLVAGVVKICGRIARPGGIALLYTRAA